MTVLEVMERMEQLAKEGHGEEEVYLDTDPHDLFTIGDIDLDSDGVGVIIWKA